MKKQGYISILKDEMIEFVKLRKSQGFKTEQLYVFASLDKYLVLHNITLKTLNADVVEGWLASEHSTKKAVSVNHYVAYFKAFAKYLHLIGIDVFVPDYLRTSSSYVPYIFTEQEVTSVFAVADNIGNNRSASSKLHFALLLRILYGSGLRLGEALSLRKSDVDFENGVIFIRNAKNNKDRLVPIDLSLTEILSLYCNCFMKDKTNDSYLFESDTKVNGQHLVNRPRSRQWAEYVFDNVLKTAGIEKPSTRNRERGICLHCFRHTFVVHSFRKQELAGIDNYDAAPSISPYVGHHNLNGTQKYLHMTAENSKDIIDSTNKYSIGMFPKIELTQVLSKNKRVSANKKTLNMLQEKATNEFSKGMFPEVPL